MYNNINLDNKLYCNDTNTSFTDILEELDPSDWYSGFAIEALDAYERQLRRYNLKVKGKDSSKVNDFFKDNNCAILFPEFINRLIKKSYNLDRDIYFMTNEELAQIMLNKKENKIMNDTIENIDKQIEELYTKRAELEMKAEAKRKEEEKKKAEEKKKSFESIKNIIKEHNEKYDEHLVLGREGKYNDIEMFNLFPWW